MNSYAVTKFPSATVHQYDVSLCFFNLLQSLDADVFCRLILATEMRNEPFSRKSGTLSRCRRCLVQLPIPFSTMVQNLTSLTTNDYHQLTSKSQATGWHGLLSLYLYQMVVTNGLVWLILTKVRFFSISCLLKFGCFEC